MKNIFKLIFVFILCVGYHSCSDKLDTVPTSEVSPQAVFSSTDAAYAALGGIYRSTYLSGWTTGNQDQNFGIMSTNLYADLMGEDMVQHEQGNGWFWYDYIYNVRSRYSSSSWRPYATWNFYYTLISNANYILTYVSDETPGAQQDIDNILGQAYAIRAYCYFYLIQTFQKTYIGHENDPGIPVYTGATAKDTEGKPRGTVQATYDRINEDIDKAIELLKNATPQKHISNIDYYVANGIKARIALVQNRWADAESAAKEALSKDKLLFAQSSDILSGFNNTDMPGVMWGAKIIEDQATVYASFGSHMDASVDMYANASRKCISNWLYDQIADTDARKKWWKTPEIFMVDGQPKDAKKTGDSCSYNQVKFRFKSAGSYASDYIYMRAEEMAITAAEALCRQKKYTEARGYIRMVGDVRDPDYAARLAKVTDSDEQSFSSAGNVSTLLDEILVQRRIELWCEVGRIFDILRMKKGFYRDWTDSNHANLLDSKKTSDPEWWDPILTIPQSEFDGNTSLTPADQNGGL